MTLRLRDRGGSDVEVQQWGSAKDSVQAQNYSQGKTLTGRTFPSDSPPSPQPLSRTDLQAWSRCTAALTIELSMTYLLHPPFPLSPACTLTPHLTTTSPSLPFPSLPFPHQPAGLVQAHHRPDDRTLHDIENIPAPLSFPPLPRLHTDPSFHHYLASPVLPCLAPLTLTCRPGPGAQSPSR